MKMWTLKITSGWRITLPPEVLKILDVRPGDKIYWVVDENGIVHIKKKLSQKELSVFHSRK